MPSARTTKRLGLPISEAVARSLQADDFVLLTGRVLTARDAVHSYLAAGGAPPCDLCGSVLYHCGPIAVAEGASWRITAAGPTTSMREEPYMAELIARYRLRGIIGKGGMGQRTLAACRDVGCVYFHAVGGAAQTLASRIEQVKGVYFLERFGAPEAVWELTVKDFPVMVTMDSQGASLHERVSTASQTRLDELLARGT